jgi:vancomycin resistance protein VanW
MFSVKPKLLSERYKLIYWIRVWQKRSYRWCLQKIFAFKYAKNTVSNKLHNRYSKHRSKLIKDYGESDPRYMQWQYNKVTNLNIAIKKINLCVIHPGEIFSFWNVVGRPTSQKGYLEGMELSRGKARAGIGGGLCQLSNLLNWMAWHTPLTIKERSLHSFDPFPDKGRVLPFGSGAALFWNYVDWQVENTTSDTFQIVVWIDGDSLKGEIRSSGVPVYAYRLHEKNHGFIKKDDIWYRHNEIWRTCYLRGKNGQSQQFVEETCLVKNFSRVCYEPTNASSVYPISTGL